MKRVNTLLFLLLLAGGARLTAQGTPPAELIAYPDLILHNGKILTADDKFTTGQAIAIRDGKFIAVGNNNRVVGLAGPQTRKMDLQGKTVVPGFISHHLHLPDYATQALLMKYSGIQFEGEWVSGGDWLNWKDVDSLLRDVKKVADVTPPGQWAMLVAAFEAEPIIRKLRRTQLDAVTPNHPFVIRSPVAGNVFAANTAGLKKAKILPGSELFPPDDTAILRGQTASWFVSLDSEWGIPMDKLYEALKRKIGEYNGSGITMIGGTRIQPVELTALREIWARGELTMRWRVALQVLNEDPDPEYTLRRLGNLSDIGDDMLRIGGMALGSTDGAPYTGGAWTWQPKMRELPGYPSRPYGARDLNAPWEDREKVALIVKYGWSAANSHSAGDRGTTEYLSTFEEAKKNPIVKSSTQRLAIDHLVIVRPEDIPKFKELGILPSISPWFVFKRSQSQANVHMYGPDRVNRWMPAKSYIDAGLRPIIEEDIDELPYRAPLWNMEKLISRKDDDGKVWNSDERVTREQALWMKTLWTAAYTGDEKKLGSIEPGKLADVLVLDRDYLTVPEDEIHKIEVLTTIVGGKIVYEKR